MSNNSLVNRVNNLEQGLSALLNHFGLNGQQGQSAEPDARSSARVRETAPQSQFAKKAKSSGKKLDDVVITVTQAMADGRMKIPARMFVKGRCFVDGTDMGEQLASDQNRSAPFTPHLVLGVEVDEGDVVTFTHQGGSHWESSVVAGRKGRKQAKPVQSPKAKTSTKSKAKRVASDDDETERFTVPQSARRSVKALIEFFGKVASDNSTDPDFEVNPNIKASMKASGRKEDARMWLNTAEQQKFRKYRKALGLGLEESISLLNDEYNSYE